jgi:hypothetical protein
MRRMKKTGSLLSKRHGWTQGWATAWALACCLAAGTAWAQATVAWSGAVRSASGQPVAGATVVLTGESGIYRATTGSDGSFVFPKIPPDRFGVVVQRSGKPATAAVQVQLPGNPVTITVTNANTLQMAALGGDAGASGTTGGEKLSSESVSSLPLNGRDFSTLLLLAAGTMTDVNGATNFTQQFAINGQRGVEAVFAMDGADVSDPEMGGSTFTNFNVDAIQELQSSSGWMPAEIGRGAAGFTNIVTRSGREGFHGSVFEFLRNSALDARNYFDYPSIAEPGRIPPFKRNEFGFTNGGPVVLPHLYDGRGKTFYFGQYQGFRQVLGTTQVLPMPTAAERAGQDVVKYPDGSTDTLTVPGQSGDCRRPEAVSDPQQSDRSVRRADVCGAFECGNECGSVLDPHRSAARRERRFPGAIQLRQPDRPDNESGSDHDR